MERTGRRVISIDLENNKHLKAEGEIQTLLSQMQFIIAFLYMELILKGLDPMACQAMFDQVIDRGMKLGHKVENEKNEVKGDELYYKKLGIETGFK